MATIPIQNVSLPGLGEYSRCRMVLWEEVGTSDAGAPVEFPNFADRSVQVVGTFGAGGTLVLEGSLDGTNYATLTDPQGNALSFTSTKIETITEAVRYLRPRVTAGDGTTDLDVYLLAKG